jgi:hypothetical protein
MTSRFTTWALLAAFVTSMVALPASTADAQQTTPAINQVAVPVTGTFTDAANNAVGTVTGTFNISRFQVQNGQLQAVGTLTATLTDGAGNIIRTIITQIVRNITESQGSCEILFLELGPLELNLLGLQVFLDQITLEIVAQPGPGNLLGNLLCAIAGLLDSPGQRLANLLNQLLGAL